MNKYPFLLIILDGWGIAPPGGGNAVTLARTPIITDLQKSYPYTLLEASGVNVGLPKNQVGNSEAGHMNLGAGRIVEQDVRIISQSINTGIFFKNPAFLSIINHVKKFNSNMHLIGLLSSWQSPHVELDHVIALSLLLRDKEVKNVFLHLFTDGRDSPRFSALKLIKNLKENFKNNEKIASLVGRFYAMDRNKKWERTRQAYELLTEGKGIQAKNAEEAIISAYNRGQSDEFIQPTIIVKKSRPLAIIKDNDAIIFYNLRSDRTRQLTKAFVQEKFTEKNPGSFKRNKILKNLLFVALTEFGPDLDSIITAYPSKDISDTLPMVLRDKKQLYLAETEKYAHVTYFFNGGYADPVAGESRLMIPSPYLMSYDQKPEMSAGEITDKILEFLRKKQFDFYLINYANPDMIGHTGNLKAGIKAVEFVDYCVGLVVKETFKNNGQLIITADHGNIEEMINLKTGEIDTEHSANPVPFFLLNQDLKNKKVRKDGILGDVAPTILDILEIDKPKAMTRRSLLI